MDSPPPLYTKGNSLPHKSLTVGPWLSCDDANMHRSRSPGFARGGVTWYDCAAFETNQRLLPLSDDVVHGRRWTVPAPAEWPVVVWNANPDHVGRCAEYL